MPIPDYQWNRRYALDVGRVRKPTLIQMIDDVIDRSGTTVWTRHPFNRWSAQDLRNYLAMLEDETGLRAELPPCTFPGCDRPLHLQDMHMEKRDQ